MTSIDRLDVEILNRLTENARAGIAELAAELGVSRTTVHLRLRHLEEDGVLLGFRPIINFAAVGAPVQALISIELDQQLLAEIIEGLSALPHVIEVRIQAGREDLLAHVALPSLEDLQILTASIVAIAGVRKTTSTFSVSTPIPYRLQPLLDHLTQDKGWGRSTPAPMQ